MKRFCSTFLSTLFSVLAFSQSTLDKHPSILGIQVTLYDFKKTSPIRNYYSFNPGLSVIYVKGLTNHLDLQADFTGSFPDSTAKNENSINQSLLLQATIAARIRLNNSAKGFQPYLLTGIGISNHNNSLAGYVTAGPGMEAKYQNIYFLLSVQYHLSLSENLNNHYSCNIGVAGLISKTKKQKTKSVVVGIIQPSKILDTDNDGIADSLDHCPSIPGLLQFNGCPDTDGDGIPDYADQCPITFGYEKYKGCPSADRDKDGIADEADQCPNIPGTIKYHGCPVPDTDGDGINDEQDNCVNIAGPKFNHGCPVIVKDMTDQINLAASNIFFKTASFELLPYSFTALDNLVRILAENKSVNLTIAGHTDNVGSQKTNQRLSENRAKTVAKYLSSKGIEKSRLTAIGYGRQKPIATNNTEGGRAKNRRVELKAN